MEELEIMRQQLTSMKQQLDTQKIIHKDLLRKIMRGKASWLNKFVYIELLTLPLIYLLLLIICGGYGISHWYATSFIILGILDVAFDWRTVRIPSKLFGTSTILGLKKFLLRQMKERFIQTCIGLPLAIIWLIAFFMAIVASMDINASDDIMRAARTGGVAGGIAGGIIGAIVVIILYKRIQRTNTNLLNDIRELEND